MLEIPYARTAYRLWVNGKLVAFNGRVSADPREVRPEYRPVLTPIPPPSRSGTLEIVVQVANAHFRSGGLPKSIILGYASEVERYWQKRLMLQMFLIGALSLMGILYAIMYAGQRSERTMLYFSLLAGDIAVRTFVTGELPIAFVLPDFPWEFMLRIEYVTGYFATGIFLLFLHSLYPQDISKRVTRFYVIFGAVGCVLAAVLPVRITSLFVPYHSVTLVLAFPYLVFTLVRATFKRKRASKLTFICGLVFMTAALLTMFHYNQLWIGTDLVPHGLFVLLVSEAITLSNRYSTAFRRVSELAEQNGQLLEETRRRLFERDRLYRLLTEQDEKTRRRIAEALHGGAQARLFQAAQMAEEAARLVDGDPGQAAKLMRSVHDLVEQVREHDIREASHRLHPAAIAAGLVGAIDALCNRLPDEIAVELQVDPRLADLDDPGGSRLKESLRLGLYRIVEEALNNIQRHARTQRVRISLGLVPPADGEGGDARIELIVADDGVGFDPGEANHGLGLQLIAARAVEMGGEWRIISAPGEGTELSVVVPLELAGSS